MNLTDAVKSIMKPHDQDKLNSLTTVFGETLDDKAVLQEYPRPQLKRDSYINLNGWWDYTILPDYEIPEHKIPDTYTGKLLVPFSPEASLSGVKRQLQPDETLWYQREVPVDRLLLESGCHLILHFGAVDCLCEVYINGLSVCSHEGGYLPFQTDLTPFLIEGINILTVRVKDYTDTKSYSRGKQVLKRGGIFYTAQSGIWQTVWMEWVPRNHIVSIKTQTDYDTRTVTVRVLTYCQRELPLTMGILFDGKSASSENMIRGSSCAASSAHEEMQPPVNTVYTLKFLIPSEHFHSWSPETPSLYTLRLTLDEDSVESYFAMRCFTVEKQNGIPVFCLNHTPCFLMGILDQGYWPDGLYTAPSDEALIYDIQTARSMGFNMLRKHIKIESARWYYHCDRLGMIVCQDMVNGGGTYRMPFINYLPTLSPSISSHIKDSAYSLFSRKDRQSRVHWEKECLDTVEYLQFFPSIAIWVPFNEGWGQFDSLRITDLIKAKDPSRLVDSASGWFDQGGGDFISVHNYFRPLSVSVKKWGERAFLLSEYGGFACHIKNHSSVERIFGYKRYENISDLKAAYLSLMEESIIPLKTQGLCGAVYTQLSDVEEEVNGLLTYDRKINKLTSQ